MNPGFESLHCIARPDQDISKVIDILKLLPKTNCQQCGEPPCMVLAVRMAEGAKGTENRSALDAENKQRLENYMRRFNFD